ncbi:type II toxin-antitoxin system RelE/ParE family toxin [Ciceribacter sp. RN22]|uniref:type II toxin-antitoxin system RelE/ParE family toxin n=1 Tax=Ciceribacter sp. RN22 TaxID=2954932 RepID=UPI002093DFA8|nr:type II toxin-antitoxin system RelE/ParE family toxin [Ciceribacter sp. RN22]MCO6177728.1 type II toxin-antitoxin system RelE/ParE family toxin [Ciceribacter sp. RN22]
MPKSREVVWSRKARQDLRSIYRHIARFSPVAANRFALDLYNKIENLARLGLTGTSMKDMGDDIRVFTYRDRRFFVRVTDETVTVLRVMHGRQDTTTENLPESDT